MTTVAELLEGYVSLVVESLDRLYLNPRSADVGIDAEPVVRGTHDRGEDVR